LKQLYPIQFLDNLQERFMIALYQTSIMGKTKLCFSYGITHFVVMIRNFEGLELPFKWILDEFGKKLLHEWGTIEPKKLSFCFYWNQRLIELWILTHVELFEHFCNDGIYFKGC
jgi:hypothetical protein